MGQPYIGEIRVFAGNFAPAGWALCQGQLVNISDYDTLFTLIGTTYGGDGQETFGLPDLRSRIPMHQGAGYPLGATGGAESVQLTVGQLPNHTHPVNASSQDASATSPQNAVWATTSLPRFSTDPAAPLVAMSASAVPHAGGGQPHDNMSPFLAVNFIISLYGIYPSPT